MRLAGMGHRRANCFFSGKHAWTNGCPHRCMGLESKLCARAHLAWPLWGAKPVMTCPTHQETFRVVPAHTHTTCPNHVACLSIVSVATRRLYQDA
eukprot:1822890-Alexandrium_andersonii.AAC.1